MKFPNSLRSAFVVLSALFVTGCSYISLATVNLLSLGFDGEVVKDVAYGNSGSQKVDIYLPEQLQGDSQSMPVVVFFHGGAWRDGSKGLYRFVGATLASRGFVVVVPDYRKYPEVVFPVFIEDTAAAIAWTLDNIGQYGGNPDHLFISGHSSGAHMGALVLTDQRYLAEYDISPDQVSGFIGLSGPYSFTPQEENIIEVFGDMTDYRPMQVDNFVDGGEPPMLLLHGLDDRTVGRINIDRLQPVLEDNGVEVTSRFYPDTDHTGILANFSAPYQADSELLQDMIDFMHAQM